MANFKIIFDDVILNQLKQSGKNQQIRDIISKLFDKIENIGSRAGN